MTGSNMNNKASSVSDVLVHLASQNGGVSSTQGATAKEPSSESFYVPMGQMAFIVGAMQKMLQYSVDQTEILAQNQQASTLAYMGGTEDANGVITVDYTKGIIYSMQQTQIDAGNEEAQGLREQASGHWASMGSSVVGVGGVVGNFGKNILAARLPNAELTSLTADKNLLNGGPQPDKLQIQGNTSTVEMASTYEVKGQTAAMTKGNFKGTDNPNVKNTALSNLANLTDDQSKANRKLVEEKLNEQIKDKKDILANISSGEQTWNIFLNQATGAATNGFQAFYTGKQAEATEAKAKDNAAASVLQTVQQQWTSSLDRTREQADAARQEAIQVANMMAQIQNTRV